MNKMEKMVLIMWLQGSTCKEIMDGDESKSSKARVWYTTIELDITASLITTGF